MHIPRTICFKCKHCHYLRRWNHNKPVWYDIHCHAVQKERAQDPVTGEHCFVGKNDFSSVFFTDERYPTCRSMNANGECPLYQAGKPTTTSNKDD